MTPVINQCRLCRVVAKSGRITRSTSASLFKCFSNHYDFIDGLDNRVSFHFEKSRGNSYEGLKHTLELRFILMRQAGN